MAASADFLVATDKVTVGCEFVRACRLSQFRRLHFFLQSPLGDIW